MNTSKKWMTRAAGLGLGAALLTGCIPPEPTYYERTALTFTHPELDAGQYELTALYFASDEAGKVEPRVLDRWGMYGSEPTGSGWQRTDVRLSQYDLNELVSTEGCVTSFAQSKANMQNLRVSPNTVRVCNVYFVINRAPANRVEGWVPAENDVVYETHSLYSYATENFTYSLESAAGNSTETGQRRMGWSLVRHEVMQPSATPEGYRVTMNSVPEDMEALPIRMHEPTDYFTSMSLSTAKQQSTDVQGGAQ